MALEVVGMADCRISKDPGSVLVTYALGSCIGLALYDPIAKVSGMLHYMLPESSLDPAKAAKNPWMFADSGTDALLRELSLKGADKRRLRVYAAGGAQVLDPAGVFNIGKRNYLALRKLLWKAGLLIAAEDVGGTVSRSLRIETESGRCWTQPTGLPGCLLEAGAASRQGVCS